MSRMQNNDFQLTISSTNCLNIFPNNKPQSFKVRLPSAIDLVGDWDVALMHIQYPRNWFNVQELHEILFSEFKINRMPSVYDTPCTVAADEVKKSDRDLSSLYNMFGDKDREQSSTIQQYHVSIEPGFYPSPASIMWRLEEQLREKFFKFSDKRDDINFPINIYYDENEDRCKFKGPENWAWAMPKDSPLFTNLGILKTLVGPNGEDYEWSKFPLTGEFTNMSNWSSIYVYTDIIKPQLVGEAQLPLIGIAPVTGENGITSHWNCIPPYYLPVSKTYINDIEFQIKTDHGDFVPFRKGIVIIRLHFKRH